jgi:hypothetical protein
MEDAWKNRRDTAKRLLRLSQKVIGAAEKLKREEAWIKTRFELFGTGRLTWKDFGVGSIDDIVNLYGLIKLHEQFNPTLAELADKRKPRIDDDENLLLYLMAAYLNLEFQNRLSAGAVHQEIATLINAWGDSLVVEVGDLHEIDQRDIERRIARFREQNKEVAASIDSNPLEYILFFLGETSDVNGLKRDNVVLPDPALAEPDIHSLSQILADRHRRLSVCSPPVLKQSGESLGS